MNAVKYNLNNAVGNIMRGRSITTSLLSGVGGKLGGVIGSFMQGMTVVKESADVYITDLDTGDDMQLAYVPEQISANESAKFQSYSIIDKGEVKVPKGVDLTKISWYGILPGEPMLGYAYIKESAWEEPDTIIKRWNKWKDKGTKLNLMITQTSINLSVYLQNFSLKSKGGMGNVEYSISFVQAKDLLIKTVAEVDAEKAAEKEKEQEELRERRKMKKPKSTFLKTATNLWTVAQQFTGNGGNWQNILAYNAGKIMNTDNLKAGMKVLLP